MTGRCLAALALLITTLASGAEPTWQQRQNLPDWAALALGDATFVATYALSVDINPYFLQGDFNGDGQTDLAVLVLRKATGERGIAIVHSGDTTAIVAGAGQGLGTVGQDFGWLDAWSVYPCNPRDGTREGKSRPTNRGDALLLEKLEAASGLLYWDGTAYRWRQQGD